jgi:VanZ family protein
MDDFFVPKNGRFCKLNYILIASPPRFRLSSGMSKLKVFLKFWLPMLLWMALIFTASGDSHSSQHSSRFIEPFLQWLFPKMSPTQIEDVNFMFRKCAHLAEYAILALLVWRALHLSKNQLPAWSWPKVGGTLLVVFLYAASDEYHQSFVPTRTAQFSDVLIDTTGAAVGLLGFWLFKHFKNRWRPRQK